MKEKSRKMKNNVYGLVTIVLVAAIISSCGGRKSRSVVRSMCLGKDSLPTMRLHKTEHKLDTAHVTVRKALRQDTKGRNTPPSVAHADMARRMVSKFFSCSDSDTLRVGRAQLAVPRGAMTHGRTLSITPLRRGEIPPLPTGLVNVTGGEDADTVVGYRFLPHGNHFVHCPATLTVPYDSTLIPSGYTAADIHTYYYDGMSRRWTLLRGRGTDRKRAVAMAETTHFTDVVNGILKVPESPETSSYVPTGISDLKAADPGAGIQQMEAPIANQQGTASMEYPFELPSGRGGISINVGLSYSNQGGSGMVGYGWSLPVRSVDVETRWGVPRFDSEVESESYLLMGERLGDRAYRSATMRPRMAERHFQPMVEGNFNRIVRHGSTPADYWWEVTDKDGTTYAYGGKDGKVDDASTLTDTHGNRIKWVLTRITDAHGNFASLRYTKHGGNLYPDRYTYTGFGDEEGLYSVEFAMEQDARHDAVSSGRLGVLQEDAALLRRVSVRNDGNLLRAYELHYKEGAFGKTLLASIDQLDSHGDVVATHSMDYYDDVVDGLFTTEPVTYTSESDNYGRAFSQNVGLLDGTISLLGAGTAKGTTVGGGVMVGAGWGPASVNAGASYSHSKGANEGKAALVDLNGDGLPDKLWKGSDGKLHYRLNLNADGKHPTFGEAHLVEGVNSFSKGSTSSNTLDANVAVGFGIASSGYAVGKTTEESKTQVYLHDFNSDGLVDVAVNGTVYFNHSDGKSVFFSPSSSGTDNPIVGGDCAMDSTFLVDYKVLRDSLERQYPLHDAVRLWRAPFEGTVTVTGDVFKPSSEGDGVSLSVQHGDRVIWKNDRFMGGTLRIPAMDLEVKPGDFLLFRCGAIYSGAGDAIDWHPHVRYVSLPVPTYAGEALTDYDSEADALMGEASTAPLSIDGKVSFEGAYAKGRTSDDIMLSVVRTDKAGVQVLVDSLLLPADSIVSGVFRGECQSVVSDSATLDFIARANSPVDWHAVSWNPVLRMDTMRFEIAPQRIIYSKPIRMAASTLVSLPADTAWGSRLILVPHLSVSRESGEDRDSADVHLSLKTADGTFLYARTLAIGSDNALHGDSIVLDVSSMRGKLSGKEIQVTFSIANELASASEAGVELCMDSTIYVADSLGIGHAMGSKVVTVSSLPACVFSSYNRFDYGTLYHGWGQFAWNGNDGASIRVADMRTADTNAYLHDGKLDEDAVEANAIDITEQRFFTMAYQSSSQRYVSATDSVYVTGAVMRPSRLGEDDIVIDSVDYATGGEGLAAPVQRTLTKGRSKSYSLGASAGVSIGVNRSESTQDSYTKVSLQDINGDGYPDWVNDHDGKIRAQLTCQTGRLGDAMDYAVEGALSRGKSSNTGLDIGASFDAKAYSIGQYFQFPKTSKEAESSSQSTAYPSDAESAGNAGKVSENGSCSASGNFSSGETMTARDWSDLNGDGLPDMVSSDGMVRYGLGYSYTDAMASELPGTDRSVSSNLGGGNGVCIPVLGMFSISSGMNDTQSLTMGRGMLADVNGDGLPDYVSQEVDGSLSVTLNRGDGFMEKWDMGGRTAMSASVGSSLAFYGSVAYTIRIPLPFGFRINITPSVQASHSESVSRTTASLIDMDGDGLPDLVCANGENRLLVYRNLTGRTNLLKSVTLPFGGRHLVEYAQTEPSHDLPGRRWVMSAVETVGGYAECGATRTRTEFDYHGGYQDRKEREFLGFQEVVTTEVNTLDSDRPYRRTVRVYDGVRDYHTHSLLTSETLYDADANKLHGTSYSYDLRDQQSSESKFPALVKVEDMEYDPGTGVSMGTNVENDYDGYGNLTFYRQTAIGHELEASVDYHELADKYIIGEPSHVAVSSGGKVLRERTSEVNSYGDMTRLTLRNGDGASVYDMEYDAYGNITRLTKPANHRGQRMFHAYAYDERHHSLVTGVSDAYGYSSSTSYDPLWNLPTSTTDINGQRMEYTYDVVGRQSTVRAPYEIESGRPFTIKFEYNPRGRMAHTIHDMGKGYIDTYTFADSLMDVVQTKHTGVVWNGTTGEKVAIVSGREVEDAFGRKVATYYPTTESVGDMGRYSHSVGDLEMTTKHDERDREVLVTLADGARTQTAYAIGNHGSEPMLTATYTDALGRTSEKYSDALGRERETVRHADGVDVTVKKAYDALGQLLDVTHPNGAHTTYAYDELGRKLSVVHPDAGKVEYTYDAAGNMLTKLTAELERTISSKAPVTYTYDFERLSEVLYPENLFNRVTYTYGKAGDPFNRAGRIALVEDASGGEAYSYGRMGEVTKTVRTVMASLADVRTYIYGATYDSWNRVRTMTYPDGEVVTYHYDAAGQVESLTSTKLGRESTIVEKVGYDKEGHTVYSKLGNGMETTYSYDKVRDRLERMELQGKGGKVMSNAYSYDAVDNILGMENSISPQSNKGMNPSKLGGTFSHSYRYDKLDRLVNASGKAKNASYVMDMAYNVMSMPLHKYQEVDSSLTAHSYRNDYLYEDTSHPTAPTQIGHEHYTYDANGNPTLVEDDSLGTTRQMFWDEDNRLMVLSDNGKTSRYTYNASGERIVKSHGNMEGVYVNGAPQRIAFHETDDFTLYPASILSVSRNRFTKHYFIGSQRIASRIGVGRFNNVYGINGSRVTAGQKDYAARMSQIEAQKEEYYKSLGIAPGVPTMKGSYGDPENTGVGYNSILTELGKHDVPENWIQLPKNDGKGNSTGSGANATPGGPVAWEDPSNPENAQPGYGYVAGDTTELEETFYYHSDHLGSTSYVTDEDGNITQYEAYLPYGELLVDEHSSSESMPYKFNGKQLDDETGLYYYGARYMNPVASIWYGVDPLTDKYPNVGAIGYCVGNPISFKDIEGKFPFKWMANLSRCWYNLFHKVKASPVVRNNTGNIKYRYTYNSVSREGSAYVVTAHYKYDKRIAENVQNFGDITSVAGYIATLSVIGSDIGIPLAATGNAISSVGAIMEILIDGANLELDNVIKDALYIGFERATDKVTNKILFSPNANNKNKQKFGDEIIKQGVNLKETGVERIVDTVIEKKKNDKQ